MCLTGVFDHRQTMFLRDRENRVHVRGLSVEMNRDDGLGSRCNCRLDSCRIHRPVVGLDVDEHWLCAGVLDRCDRGDKGERYRDHLISRTDASCQECQVKGARAAVHTNGFSRGAERREVTFERRHGRTEYVRRLVEHLLNRSIDLGLQRPVLRLQIYVWNHVITARLRLTSRPRSATDSVAASRITPVAPVRDVLSDRHQPHSAERCRHPMRSLSLVTTISLGCPGRAGGVGHTGDQPLLRLFINAKLHLEEISLDVRRRLGRDGCTVGTS